MFETLTIQNLDLSNKTPTIELDNGAYFLNHQLFKSKKAILIKVKGKVSLFEINNTNHINVHYQILDYSNFQHYLFFGIKKVSKRSIRTYDNSTYIGNYYDYNKADINNTLNVRAMGVNSKVDIVLATKLDSSNKTIAFKISNSGDQSSSNLKILGLVDHDSNLNIISDEQAKLKRLTSNNKQEIKIIVLDDQSKVKVEPILRIHSHNTSGSHGCAIGRLNEESLFYLMSKGLSLIQIQELISDGLFKPINEQIPDIYQHIFKEVNDNVGH